MIACRSFDICTLYIEPFNKKKLALSSRGLNGQEEILGLTR